MSVELPESSDDAAVHGEPPPAAVGKSAPPAPATGAPTTAQVLLGVLIVWQILFLVVANALDVLHSAKRITGRSQEVGAIVDHVSGGIGQRKGHWYEVYYL